MAKVKKEREKHERPLRLRLGSDASFPLHTIGQSKLQDSRHREIHNVCMRRAAKAVARGQDTRRNEGWWAFLPSIYHMLL